jgi:peptidoglycan/LPS O-acetylase OafA/YrhL
VGLLVIGVAFAVRTPNSWTSVYFSFICAAGFGCLVAAAVMRRRKRASRGWVPVSRYLRQLGAISCGIYLWHEPVMLLLRSLGVIQQSESEFVRAVVIVVAASILVGWLSCEAIERPTRRLGHFFERNAIQRSASLTARR